MLLEEPTIALEMLAMLCQRLNQAALRERIDELERQANEGGDK